LVAREDLPQVEALLLSKGGWEWVKEDAYDDAYYRDHMHELPPLIHKERDRMIDVHHTILPLTAKPKPDAVGMLAGSIPLPFRGGVRGGASPQTQCPPEQPHPNPSPKGEGGLAVLSPTDMVIHCAAHMIADGDLAGGLRNLWDFHCLTKQFAESDPDFWPQLSARAARHQLLPAVQRAARLSHCLYGTAIPQTWYRKKLADAYFIRRLTARDVWGRPTRKVTRLAFYIRSHWMRMPPLMLARHLWTKWRKG
jgi:hypothetical protein